MGDLAGTGDDDEDWHERCDMWSWCSVSPASGGEGDPESDNSTQIPESKLRLDCCCPLLPGTVMLEMSGSLRYCLRVTWSVSPWSPDTHLVTTALVSSCSDTVGRWSTPEIKTKLKTFFKTNIDLVYLQNFLQTLSDRWYSDYLIVSCIDKELEGERSSRLQAHSVVFPLYNLNISLLDKIFIT